MKRRVVEQGGLTLMISLPRKWAKKYGLKKGDEIELSERGKELLLSTEKAIEEEATTTVKIEDTAKFMGRLVHAPYRFGYNEVEIKYSDPSAVPKIQEYLDQLLGFEIVEQGTNYMKVQMVAKELETEFEKMLRRILFMAQDMAKELYLGVKDEDTEKLKGVAAMEKMNNKLTNFCERMLNKHGYPDTKKTGMMYCTVWAMEQVADEISEMCKALAEDTKVGDETLDALEGFSKEIEQFNTVFYKHDYDSLWDFREKHNAFLKTLDNIKAKTKTETKTISLMRSVVEKLRHLTLSLV
jgi:phosphate uptake regulator